MRPTETEEESKLNEKQIKPANNQQNFKLPFYHSIHESYLLSLEKSKDLDSIGYYLTEHLRIAGAYWSLTALAALGYELPKDKKEALVTWMKSCANSDGGYGGNTGHDSHITSTHYAILVFILFDRLEEVDVEKTTDYIAKLQNENGSFLGDTWGECDTRFSYCALSSLKLLNKLNKINVEKACEFVLSCRNFDGSFGGLPDMESHGAYVFCCVGTLAIADYLKAIDRDMLAAWLSERQTLKGGFNGRPEKLADVCYSWWIYSSLVMMKREMWIDQLGLENFILECQDEQGGIADRPGNVVDVFHTFFGIAALSLLDKSKERKLDEIDPTFALPKKILYERFPHVRDLLYYRGKQASVCHILMITNAEKSRLKDSIINKLFEKYKVQLPEDLQQVIHERVEGEVNDYLRHQQVNDKTLRLLEKRIKKFKMEQMIRARDRSLNQPKITSPEKKTSFPVFGKYLKSNLLRSKSSNNIIAPLNSGMGQTLSTTTSKKSFYQSGPNGADEWAYLVQFDSSIHEKEKELLGHRKHAEQKKLKMFLDSQIKEKHSQRLDTLMEEKNYHDYQEGLARDLKLKDKEEKRMKDEHKKELKKSQEKQLKDYYNAKMRERSREMAADQVLVNKLFEEKQKDDEMAKKRKIIKKQQLQKIIRENQDKKKRDFEDMKKERLFDKQTEEEYNRQIEKQEAERKAKILEKDENSKKYLRQIYDKTIKEHKENEKLADIESQNYFFAQNMEAIKNEIALEEKRRVLRHQMKEELGKQIVEKKNRRHKEALENLNFDNQMEKDRQEFLNAEKLRMMTKKNSYKDNQNYLKVQMKKRIYDIERSAHMTQDELFQNKPELKGISQEERSLERSVFTTKQERI